MNINRIMIANLLFASSAFADAPSTFSYQGILTDSLGESVADDIYAIQFGIYKDSVTTEPLWASYGFIPKQTTDGLFNHILGSTYPLPDSLSRYDDLWIGITVDLDGEMTPSIQLNRVPLSELYAREAQEAIAAIMAAVKVHYAETGLWVTDVRQLSKLQLDRLTEDRWKFDIIPGAQGIHRVQATSTGQMPGGAGKVVKFDVVRGKWSGYGSNNNK